MSSIRDTHKYHTVKSGETLSGIAKKYGLTLEQLYNLNPTLPKNPKLLQIGTKIETELTGKRLRVSSGTIKTTQMVCMPDATFVENGIKYKKVGGYKKIKTEIKTNKNGKPLIVPDSSEHHVGTHYTNSELGSLSSKYESNGNPGTISSGRGDHGGVSYGSYQLSTNMGTMNDFMTHEGKTWYALRGLQPKTSQFNDKWKQIANEHRVAFQKSQHDYIERTHYIVQKSILKRDISLDIDKYSKTLKDVVWSVCVQHGAKTTVIKNALKNKNIPSMSEKDIIIAIYEERSKKQAGKNTLKYFKNSPTLTKGLEKRFNNEKAEALKELSKTK